MKSEKEKMGSASKDVEETPTPPVSPSAEEIGELGPDALEELRQKAAERDEFFDLMQRAKADFINFQARMKREKESWSKFMLESVLFDFLPVMDSLQQALSAAEGASESTTILEGVRMIESQLLQTLKKHGVESIETQGEFDPNVHEALMMEDRPDVPDMTILAELRRGYRLHDRVLRPAQVRVARTPATPEEAGEKEGPSSSGGTGMA